MFGDKMFSLTRRAYQCMTPDQIQGLAVPAFPRSIKDKTAGQEASLKQRNRRNRTSSTESSSDSDRADNAQHHKRSPKRHQRTHGDYEKSPRLPPGERLHPTWVLQW